MAFSRRSGDGEEVGSGPPLTVLDYIRGLSDALICASGGSRAEADIVATEVTLYVENGWTRHGLERLCTDERAWNAHLRREIYRRWLVNLSAVRGHRVVPVSQSLARARLLALAAAADLSPLDRELFDHIQTVGFSVAETARAFELDPAEVAHRLRVVETLIRSHYAEFFESP